MTLPKFEYVEPRTLKKACQVLEAHGGQAQIIAGGTDLMQMLKNRLKTPRILVDLKSVPRLNQISYSSKSGLTIGALVSFRALANDASVKEKYPMLAHAVSEVGTPQLQAMGTLGGNLCQDNLCLFYNRSPMMRLPMAACLKLDGDVCNAVANSRECWAVYSGDIAPVLMVLGATVTIADAEGKTRIPLLELYSGDGKQPHRLKPGQILTEVHVPVPAPNSGGAYLKLRQRSTIDYPLLGVAFHLTLKDDECIDAALVLTGIDRSPLFIQEAANLKGRSVSTEAIEHLAQAASKQARPLNNVVELTPRYRREMVKVYVRKAIQQALQNVSLRGGTL
ncbi:4-hydroxybenzoyl-CoA reductase subunit beta [Anaerolineae bacterium]|nr:4-hydroxybenzoyl-CoA reductase subunit beta [Anaerolineae bacterium]